MSDFRKMSWGALILAGGKGTRMKSELPKVLHQVAGRPMVCRVLDALSASGIEKRVLVIGGDIEKFTSVLNEYSDLTVALQIDRKGTADAVASGGYGISGFLLPPYANGALLRGSPIEADYVLVCTGDTPCLAAETLSKFIRNGVASNCPLGVVGMIHPRPSGYGRLVLDKGGRLLRIVEEKDANREEKEIKLCNSGIIYCRTDVLSSVLTNVSNSNQSGEYYLTDIFEEAVRLGMETYVFQTENYHEFDGVNTPEQLRNVAEWLISEGRA